MDVQIVQSMGMDVTDREGAKIHAVTAQEYKTRPGRLYFFRPKIGPGSRKVLFQPMPAQNMFV